jgi:hypothetical protein
VTDIHASSQGTVSVEIVVQISGFLEVSFHDLKLVRWSFVNIAFHLVCPKAASSFTPFDCRDLSIAHQAFNPCLVK